MKKRAGVSSRDVAKEAGVSQATVSYILNDVQNVKIKPETREAVLQAIKKLNYHPNHIARGMKLMRSMSIGIVTDHNATSYYFMRTLEGIKQGLKQQNYSITFLDNHFDSTEEAEYIRYYNSNRIDGLLFVFASLPEGMIQFLNDKGIPYVMVEVHPSERGIHEVCSDYLMQMDTVIKHLSTQYITKIGYIGADTHKSKNYPLEAFKESLTGNQLEIQNTHIFTGWFHCSDLAKSISNMLNDVNKPQAIVAGGPRYGMLAAKCALKLGLKIPEDIKITVMGSSNMYEFIYPSLTAVEIPLAEMGNSAAKMILDLIGGREISRQIILASEFVVRDSS